MPFLMSFLYNDRRLLAVTKKSGIFRASFLELLRITIVIFFLLQDLATLCVHLAKGFFFA